MKGKTNVSKGLNETFQNSIHRRYRLSSDFNSRLGVFCTKSADGTDGEEYTIGLSFGPNDIGYGKFRQNLEEELKAKGITPRITEFYLNCEFYNEQEEVERMRGYLDSVGDESVDMLLVVGDQAAYSVLKSAHPLLRKRPVVLSNIHFPTKSS